ILTEVNAVNELPVIYDNLGDLHLKKNNFDSALYYHRRSLVFAQKVGNKVMIEDAYYSLAQTCEKMREYKQAYDYLMKSYLMKDSVFDDLRSKQISEMQAKYDAERKETEILSLKQAKAINELELKNKEILMYVGLSVTVIISVLLFLLYKRSRAERKVNIKLNEQYHEISQQKREIELQRDEIKRTHEQIQSSIKYAQRIQDAILPREEDINAILPQHFLLFRPRDVVSGDFYWVHQVGVKKVIVVADCTGHGVPGAFMSMIGNELLNEIVTIKKHLEPSKILAELNKGIRRALKQEDGIIRDGMDVAICVANEGEKYIDYAGAKSSVIYIQDDQLFQIKGNRNSVGGGYKDDVQQYECHRFEVTEKTVVYLYSDGFQDQFGGRSDKRLGAKRFKELLLKNYALTLPEQKAVLENTLLTWMGQSTQTDDITILGFKLL
ncbi:MAG: SpoIIE family protein phosphatase, partial [Flammeovirgaceae bacterium]|nr:SpoIIE family protein phosphatase [Flammeovirgaceae bacterium]MDW8287889.1 SpoIIE family protein phosphatase [Flammeovirgaceae bacterium]